MFFEKDRLPIVQEMILAKTLEVRQNALDRLLPFQRKDFTDLFTAMNGLPVIIRLLDPPLHEFLPEAKVIEAKLHKMALAGDTKSDEYEKQSKLLAVVEDMHESNPMLGLRGCRVGVIYPQILAMQTRAIVEAALNVSKQGIVAKPKIMIPLVSHVNELKVIRPTITEAANAVFKERGVSIQYDYGTMVETPRAALTAGEVATEAEFFSFGTNDLTQMTFGIARDDAERKFLVHYVTEGVLPANPFQTLDQKGVGQLIELTVRNGRATRPGMSIGICGEVGGDPATINFCHNAGLDYVSCSAFRVPVARLAAAHAVISNRKKPAAAAAPRAKL
jgi:pyruvate,orthophosphate dikinase